MVSISHAWSPILTSTIFCGLMILGNGAGVCSAQESPKTAAEECSIFEVAYLNAASIRAADVLVQRDYHLDTVRPQGPGKEPRGVLVDRTEQVRYVFDFDKQLFCAIEKRGPDQQVDMADPSHQSPNLSPEYTGWALNYLKQELYFPQYEGPVPWRLTKERTMPEVLHQFKFRDPRVTYNPPSFDLLEERMSGMRELASGKNFWKKEVVDDRRLKLSFFEGRYEDGDSMVTWTFDLTNSLPLAWEVQDWHAGNKVFYPGIKQSLEWETVDGCDVIKEIRLEQFEGIRSVTGEEFYGHSETTIKFTWLSVNREHAPKFFDGTVLKSPATMRECLEEATMRKPEGTAKPAK